MAGAACLIAAAAGPRWGEGGDPGVLRGRDVVIVFDLSKSMLAEDIADPQYPTRVAAGREMLAGWLRTLAARNAGHRLALVAFAGKSALLCPLTSDYAHLAHLVEDLDPDVLPADLLPRPGDEFISGTRIGEALGRAVAAQDPNFQGYQDIILVSDGDDPLPDNEYEAGIISANASKIPVSCVGVGRPNPTNRPEDDATLFHDGELYVTRLRDGVLREIARRTRGEYYEAGTTIADLDEWFRRSLESRPTREINADLFPQPRDRTTWPLACGLFLLAGAGVLSRGRPRFSPRIAPGLALFAGASMIAAGPADVFDLRPARTALEAENWRLAEDLLAEAQPLADDPGAVAFARGVAAFHRGEFREAELLFSRVLADGAIPQGRHAAAVFNFGVCVARQGNGDEPARLRAALAAFRRCLELAPGRELADDARANVETVKLLWAKLRAGEQPPRADEAGKRPPEPKRNEAPESGDSQDAKGDKKQRVGKAAPGKEPNKVDQESPLKGAKSLPVVIDPEDPRPIPEADVASVLGEAQDRIRRERRSLRRAAGNGEVRPNDW